MVFVAVFLTVMIATHTEAACAPCLPGDFLRDKKCKACCGGNGKCMGISCRCSGGSKS
uniref:Putative chloride channel toxin Tx16 n=1 Tax=Buthus israelis TaxID=2899555 RepID=B8XH23_BUTIS|nr:putative chloride channel toxin Tx16 [Buthus occitanus israelis]